MVIQDFDSKAVFLDTAPLIYFMEGHTVYQPLLSSLFDFNDKAGFVFITSTVTLLEVLVKPLREGQLTIADQYRNILTNAPGVRLLDVTIPIAARAATFRAQYQIKTPDAIQLATAVEAGSDYFLTNDSTLKRITEVKVVTVADLS